MTSRTFALILAVVLAVSAVPAAPVRAQQDCVLPGFAVGVFGNGHEYGVGQTFTMSAPSLWEGFAVYFGEATGEPRGRVAWALVPVGQGGAFGRALALGTFRPVSMRMNEVEALPVLLPPGEYAVTLRAVTAQAVGVHWNVLVTCEDAYDGGALVQRQYDDGGDWAAWNAHDVIARIWLDAGDVVIAPRPAVLFVTPEEAARAMPLVLY